jgi:hypothetical protein
MSKLGYFLGGTLAGIAGLAAAAYLHDKYSNSSNSLPSSIDDDDALETADSTVCENADDVEVGAPA